MQKSGRVVTPRRGKAGEINALCVQRALPDGRLASRGGDGEAPRSTIVGRAYQTAESLNDRGFGPPVYIVEPRRLSITFLASQSAIRQSALYQSALISTALPRRA